MQPYVAWYTLPFVAACVLTIALTRQMRGMATRFGLVDVPDGGRRKHLRTIPRGGGIPLFIAVATVLATVVFLPINFDITSGPLVPLIFGGFAVLLLGFIDDVRDLRAGTKFTVEVLIAVALFVGGVRIDVLNVMHAPIHTDTAVSLFLTVLWIVGITNAFNLIDGSDGVAAGAALIASLTMALVAALGGNTLGAIIALTIAGATLGFLFYNFPPASIFLGDSGSLFLGYAMSALGILTAQKATTMLAVAIPVVSCGLPILDATLTLIRRFLRREPIFAGDRGHIHHRLQDLGHSPRKVAFVLYIVSATFAGLSLLLVQPVRAPVVVVFGVAGVVVCLAIQRLRIPELLELHRVLDRGLMQRKVIAHNTRVREAATFLRDARNLGDLERALTHAFGSGEFQCIELVWQTDPRSAAVRIRIGADAGRWATRALNGRRRQARTEIALKSSAPDSGSTWEICLPFRDALGQKLGSLTLWESAEAAHLLTDVRLIAVELQPALQAVLQNSALEEMRVAAPELRIVAEAEIA